MGKYLRAVLASAYQVSFSDSDKDSAKKGIPTTSHGSHIKFEGGEFSVMIHLGDDAKLAKEGDWVVEEEGGRKLIVSAEDFPDIYEEYDEVDEDMKAEPPKALEPEQTIPQPKEASAPATEGTVVTE